MLLAGGSGLFCARMVIAAGADADVVAVVLKRGGHGRPVVFLDHEIVSGDCPCGRCRREQIGCGPCGRYSARRGLGPPREVEADEISLRGVRDVVRHADAVPLACGEAQEQVRFVLRVAEDAGRTLVGEVLWSAGGPRRGAVHLSPEESGEGIAAGVGGIELHVVRDRRGA